MRAAKTAMEQNKARVPERQTEDRPPPQPDQVVKEEPRTPKSVPEIGGPKGPEPTRYGDWEKAGRCSDF